MDGFTPLQRGTDIDLEAAPGAAGRLANLPSLPLSLGATPRSWELPAIDDILEKGGEVSIDEEADKQRARLIEETLASFGAPAKVVEISRGPHYLIRR